MGVEFRWYSGDTEVVPSPPERPRSSRRLGQWLLAVGVMSLIVAGGLSWRAQRGQRAVRADLQRLVDQEILALQTWQRQAFLDLLDTRYAPWLRYHQRNFARQASWFSARPGLRARIESVSLKPDLAVAQVHLLDQRGAETEASTWFFRRVDGQWRHAPPTSDYVGPATSIETPHLTLIAQYPDRELASFLAPRLEDLWLRLARLYNLDPSPSMQMPSELSGKPWRTVVRIFPYGSNAPSASCVSSPQLGLDIWTPAERCTSVARDARVVVARAVLNGLLGRSQPRAEDWWLLEGLALWHAQAWEPEWRSLVRSSLADGSFRHLLSAQGYRSGGPREQRSQASDPDWACPVAYTLGEFLGNTYPSQQLSALLAAVRSCGSSWDAVRVVLGLSRAELEAAWEAHLQRRYQAG
jgi:hypothetical protein